MITYEDLNSEACIKASQSGRKMNNTIYIYMHGFPSLHRQQCSMGSDPMRPPCCPSDISQMEQTGMSLLPRQPHPALAVAAEALHGQDLWLALTTAACPSAAPVWGIGPSLESSQPLHNAQEEGLLANTPGASSPSSEGGQCQSAVFEARTKNPLVDEGTSPVIICLPDHNLTSYEHSFAHLPLLHTCHSTPRPCSIILQAPCNLSIPCAMELTICGQDTHCEPMEYQAQGQEADL
jgi:hypothetical protein